MLCPKCSMRTAVSDSRTEGDSTIRTRECWECGYRFKTEEKFLRKVRKWKRKGGVPFEDR